MNSRWIKARLTSESLLPSAVTWACFSMLVTLALPDSAFSQMIGTFLDQGGAVFNVKAYGALGDGSTNDSMAVQNAIGTAVSAGGGIVYFPAGRYVLDLPKATDPPSTPAITNGRADIVSLVGVGLGTQLIFKTMTGLSLTLPPGGGLSHGASIMHMLLGEPRL